MFTARITGSKSLLGVSKVVADTLPNQSGYFRSETTRNGKKMTEEVLAYLQVLVTATPHNRG
jgi:hypothetical protein